MSMGGMNTSGVAVEAMCPSSLVLLLLLLSPIFFKKFLYYLRRETGLDLKT